MEFNINSDDTTTNDYISICQVYGKTPNKIILHDSFEGERFEGIIKLHKKESGIKNSVSEYIPNGDEYTINRKTLIELVDGIFCSYLGIDITNDIFLIEEVIFYYKDDIDEDKVTNIINDIIDIIIEYDGEITPKVNTLVIRNNVGIDIEPVSHDNIDIKKYYTSETFNDIEKLVININKNERGLSILYGPIGSGKTTCLNHILSNVNRTSIFIPNNSIDLSINSLDFKDFLKRYENPLLVIDDCEFFTNSQISQISYFTANIIQIIDGFLQNNIQVLLLFNSNLSDMDRKILGCNNLIDIVKFGKLDIKTANKLSKNLGFGKRYKESITLSDVYYDKDPKINVVGL